MSLWTKEEIERAWEKGALAFGVDETILRKDACEAWILRKEYGNQDSIFGWEVDHCDPDGCEGISNLRPLQWKNHVAKGNGHLVCAVTSDGYTNVEH